MSSKTGFFHLSLCTLGMLASVLIKAPLGVTKDTATLISSVTSRNDNMEKEEQFLFVNLSFNDFFKTKESFLRGLA